MIIILKLSRNTNIFIENKKPKNNKLFTLELSEYTLFETKDNIIKLKNYMIILQH